MRKKFNVVSSIYIEGSKTHFSVFKKNFEKIQKYKNTKQAKIKQQMSKIKLQKAAIFDAHKTYRRGKLFFAFFVFLGFFLKKVFSVSLNLQYIY